MLSPRIQLNVKARRGKNHVHFSHSVIAPGRAFYFCPCRRIGPSLIATLLGVLFLPGCFTYTDCGSAEQWPKMETNKLCQLYGQQYPTFGTAFFVYMVKPGYPCRKPQIRTELEKRKTFTQSEWQNIDQHVIRIGMSKLSVLTSWGKPRDINRTVHVSVTHEQWVYGEHGRPYVYFENDILTSWQD